MGQAAFFGLGAYVVGNLTTLRFEEDYWVALLAVVPITAIIAYVLSFPLFRLRGYHFAIGTLGVGQLAYLAYNSWDWFTGGTFGTSGIPALSNKLKTIAISGAMAGIAGGLYALLLLVVTPVAVFGMLVSA